MIPLSSHISSGHLGATHPSSVANSTSLHFPSASIHIPPLSPRSSTPQHSTTTTSGTSYGNQTKPTSGASLAYSGTGTQHGIQSTAGAQYGTQTQTTGAQNGTQTQSTIGGTQTSGAGLASPAVSQSPGAYRSITLTTHGVQTSHSPSRVPSATGSPRGVATVGLVTRNGPVVNGYGGRDKVSASAAAGSGSSGVKRSKVDLSSLYEQCKEMPVYV